MDKDTPTRAGMTIGEAIDADIINPLKLTTMGKQSIKDIGARLRQIRGLKLESASIRTPEMIEEIMERLREGDTVTSITMDSHICAPSTFYGWCQRDPELNAAYKEAQAIGQRTLADIRLDIAMGGVCSTGDARRDELVIKAINTNIAQRARGEFGDSIKVQHEAVTVNIPNWAANVIDVTPQPKALPSPEHDDDD